jgi:hypothetical protein
MEKALVAMRTRGALSNSACKSPMRLFDPFTRNVPVTSVAVRIFKQAVLLSLTE